MLDLLLSLQSSHGGTNDLLSHRGTSDLLSVPVDAESFAVRQGSSARKGAEHAYTGQDLWTVEASIGPGIQFGTEIFTLGERFSSKLVAYALPPSMLTPMPCLLTVAVEHLWVTSITICVL